MLAANLRSGQGEIDLVVMDAGVRVAVEVKTRIGVDPIVEITPEKRRRLAVAVAGLRPRPRRIDAILIRLDRDGATIRRLRGVV